MNANERESYCLPGEPIPKSQTCQAPWAVWVEGCGAMPLRDMAWNQPLDR